MSFVRRMFRSRSNNVGLSQYSLPSPPGGITVDTASVTSVDPWGERGSVDVAATSVGTAATGASMGPLRLLSATASASHRMLASALGITLPGFTSSGGGESCRSRSTRSGLRLGAGLGGGDVSAAGFSVGSGLGIASGSSGGGLSNGGVTAPARNMTIVSLADAVSLPSTGVYSSPNRSGSPARQGVVSGVPSMSTSSNSGSGTTVLGSPMSPGSAVVAQFEGSTSPVGARALPLSPATGANQQC